MENLDGHLENIFKQSVNSSIKAAQTLLELNEANRSPLSIVSKNARNPLVICALGKSGYIAAKLAATLKSLDIKAEYLHANEALHGDLGSVRSDSLVILISNSGETEEVVTVAQQAVERGAICIGITAYPNSRLGAICEACFLLPKKESVCRIGLAPMSSTTVSIIICDAIANVLSFALERNLESFRKNHPGGKLGKSLSPVGLLMEPINSALVSSEEFIVDALGRMSGVGFVLVKDSKLNSTLGIFTDGDLRRLLELGTDINDRLIGEHCSQNPITVSGEKLAYEVDNLMTKLRISSVLVTDVNDKIVGTYRK